MNQSNTKQLSISVNTDILKQLIYNQIDDFGYISIKDYMEIALYHPEYGYYNSFISNESFSKDFITSSYIKIFAKLLSNFIKKIGFNSVLEYGAGNCDLAINLIKSMPEIKEYFIIEKNQKLINIQKENAKNSGINNIVWLNNIENFNGIIIANEVLDALPVELIYYHEYKPYSIGLNKDFNYVRLPLTQNVQQIVTDINLQYTDYMTEIHTEIPHFISNIVNSCDSGVVLLIDYGYLSEEYYHPQKNRGTLRGFFNHQLLEENYFQYHGVCDITSSVNWTLVLDSAEKSGMKLLNYIRQSEFLIDCGLCDELELLRNCIPYNKYAQLLSDVNKLISYNEMGDMFKVVTLEL